MEPDPHDLERFVVAQNRGGVHRQAVDELRQGRKASHWMWFVFPQVAGLGLSGMAQRYAIRSLDEARAYLSHPVLGPRLLESAGIVAETEGRSAQEIFGGIDAVKLRSSMTLFRLAASGEPVFQLVLDRYFDGVPDGRTEELLNPAS